MQALSRRGLDLTYVNSAPWCHQPISWMRRLKQRSGDLTQPAPPSEGVTLHPSTLSLLSPCAFPVPSIVCFWGVSFPPLECKLHDRWDCGSRCVLRALDKAWHIVGALLMSRQGQTKRRQSREGGWGTGGPALKVPLGIPGALSQPEVGYVGVSPYLTMALCLGESENND